MKPFTVIYERDEAGWWVTQIREVPAAITQGRTLAEARRHVREALALVLGSSAARRAILTHEVHLPPTVGRALRKALTGIRSRRRSRWSPGYSCAR